MKIVSECVMYFLRRLNGGFLQIIGKLWNQNKYAEQIF
jgi:hypothetical protein